MARPTKTEIDEVLNKCAILVDEGGFSQWPGRTFEEGVYAGIRWALGDTAEHPMED